MRGGIDRVIVRLVHYDAQNHILGAIAKSLIGRDVNCTLWVNLTSLQADLPTQVTTYLYHSEMICQWILSTVSTVPSRASQQAQ